MLLSNISVYVVYNQIITKEELLEIVNSYEVKSSEIKHLIEYNNK